MRFVLVGAGAAALLAAPAAAQQAEDESWVKVSAFIPSVDTRVSVARPGDEAFTTLIDLESDLDLSDRDVLPAAALGTRLGENWRIEGEFFTLGRRGVKTLERDIIFDGVTYPVSASIESEFSSDTYRLSIGYSFIREENYELGAAVGAHVTGFTIALEGEGTVGGVSGSTQVRRREVLAPVPTLGLYGNYRPAPRLNLVGRVDYLSLKIDDYDGRLLNLEAGASYEVIKNLRLGALYRLVDYRLEIEKDTYSGLIEYDYNGPMIFVEFAF